MKHGLLTTEKNQFCADLSANFMLFFPDFGCVLFSSIEVPYLQVLLCHCLDQKSDMICCWVTVKHVLTLHFCESTFHNKYTHRHQHRCLVLTSEQSCATRSDLAACVMSIRL